MPGRLQHDPTWWRVRQPEVRTETTNDPQVGGEAVAAEEEVDESESELEDVESEELGREEEAEGVGRVEGSAAGEAPVAVKGPGPEEGKAPADSERPTAAHAREEDEGPGRWSERWSEVRSPWSQMGSLALPSTVR